MLNHHELYLADMADRLNAAHRKGITVVIDNDEGCAYALPMMLPKPTDTADALRRHFRDLILNKGLTIKGRKGSEERTIALMRQFGDCVVIPVTITR